ncbi:MAG: hypothetical protein M3Z96_08850 [Pseudomonadota bacterium]|nr:hypothetical protein [Pseudomonadota bacterium]
MLGYIPYRAGETFTIATEEALGNGAVDTALGTFSGGERTILAPFELKGPGTAGLEAIMPGRNKSPVQQAWEYAIDAPGAKWVLVSNCAEIRLYAFGHGREQYETWDVGLLDDPGEHERLWLLIGAQNLLSGRTAALPHESANEQKDITDKLYVDYNRADVATDPKARRRWARRRVPRHLPPRGWCSGNMIGTTVIHCADKANQSSDTITCCHIDALTGESDVAPATIRVASSPAVITAAPKSGFVQHWRNGCAAFLSCCDLTQR